MANLHIKFADTIKNPSNRLDYMKKAFSGKPFSDDPAFARLFQGLATVDPDIQKNIGSLFANVNKAIKNKEWDSILPELIKVEAIASENGWDIEKPLDHVYKMLGQERGKETPEEKGKRDLEQKRKEAEMLARIALAKKKREEALEPDKEPTSETGKLVSGKIKEFEEKNKRKATQAEINSIREETLKKTDPWGHIMEFLNPQKAQEKDKAGIWK